MISTEANAKKENQHIYPIFLPKSNEKQQYSILNFRESDNVDFTNISQATIKRENNFRDFKSAYDIDTAPKYGEGSQFGKEQKDEARRKKFGMLARKYNPNDQPWVVTLGSGKEARKFKGAKCKDLLDNASYFAFIPDSDGTFTALPIDEWCDCKYVPKYKTLNIDEAEEEFSRRDKVHNKYTIMLNKRLKEEAEEVPDVKMGADNEGSNEDDSDDEVKKEKDKKKTKSKKMKQEEEKEEEGDVDEGQELDYITDESSDEEDKKENEEEGEEEDELNANESEEDEDENKDEDQNNNNNKNTDSSDTSSDSDIDNDPHLPILVKQNVQASKRTNGDSSTSVPIKKQKLETSTTTAAAAVAAAAAASTSPQPATTRTITTPSTKHLHKTTDSSSLEKQVRRYLQRKPMTSKDLIHKLRKTCASKEQLMEDIVAVLMRINPTQTKVNDKLYFTLKAVPSTEEEGKNAD